MQQQPDLQYSAQYIWGNAYLQQFSFFFPQVAKLPFVINDGKWHHICIAWTTRDGVWEAYQDGTQRGNGENLAPYHPIKPQGVLVLGQEQVRLCSDDRK